MYVLYFYIAKDFFLLSATFFQVQTKIKTYEKATWGPGNDFEGFVQGVIYNSENFRHASDKSMEVKENADGSVIISTDKNMWNKYFNDDNPWANFNEFLEFSKGLYEPIAEHMGATVGIEVTDANMLLTLKKK